MRTHRYTIVAFFFLGACGSNSIGSGPCEGDNPDPACSADCTTQACPDGFYCGADSTCTADCVPGGNQCGDGQECTDDGHCVPTGGGGPDARDCPSVQVNLAPQIPTVQLVIDQSGSMTENFGGVTRWRAVREALVDQSNGAVTQLQDRVRFGATLYSSLGGNAGGTCPLLVETSPALNNRDAIANLLFDNQPQSDTPTAESITAVANAFPPEDPNEPGPRIIVLATDGNPDNCVDPDAHDQTSQNMSEAAVQDAYSRGLTTFVLSVGDEVAQTHLQRLANAGQGLDLANGNATYYVANNSAELVDAFNSIVGGVRTCTFMLDGQVTDPTTGQVSLNGTPLEYGTDWTLPTPTTLELQGDACQTFLETQLVDLQAFFPCGTVIIL